jgi:hypothetical protein
MMAEHRVKFTDEDEFGERVYAECQECCSAFSGGPTRAYDWADKHEDDHREM